MTLSRQNDSELLPRYSSAIHMMITSSVEVGLAGIAHLHLSKMGFFSPKPKTSLKQHYYS